ncbi:hypothetical protein K8353_45195, partial [Burkholderia contaminans]|nr:hypothetical protein [Burkholderia contaminans]
LPHQRDLDATILLCRTATFQPYKVQTANESLEVWAGILEFTVFFQGLVETFLMLSIVFFQSRIHHISIS